MEIERPELLEEIYFFLLSATSSLIITITIRSQIIILLQSVFVIFLHESRGMLPNRIIL